MMYRVCMGFKAWTGRISRRGDCMPRRDAWI